ncbi:hypothetical protein [Oricola thermophila]|uniref:Uncharacterized protein n=1 Tax=Oricola thermophila TaxID=2742145 RepID=A0A6N1VEK1_9HYPH|nr:hypothetical protein [Oricola thermophila]QKV19376.1 hypothetical protein HTY61_13365 [Oricola thermophila]
MSDNELEIALKNALARGEASNPAFRQRVYRAAVNALERTLASQPDADAAHVAEQKRRLAEAIRAAEAAFAEPAPAAPASPEVQPEPRAETRGPEVSLQAEPRAERRDEAPREAGVEPEPRIEAPDREERPGTRRRAPFAKMLTGVIVLAVIVMGAWWIVSTGAFRSAAERDTSVPNPPLQLENESFRGNPDAKTSSGPAHLPELAASDEGWIVLFRPDDPTTVSLVGNASAVIESDAVGQFARIVSPDTESPVLIDIPSGVMQTLAGRTAQFSIIARSDVNAPTQISVTCDIAGQGDCGRRRFSVTQNDGEFLFAAEIPSGATGTGTVSIVTDISDGGRAVKLSGVRVRELRR